MKVRDVLPMAALCLEIGIEIDDPTRLLELVAGLKSRAG